VTIERERERGGRKEMILRGRHDIKAGVLAVRRLYRRVFVDL